MQQLAVAPKYLKYYSKRTVTKGHACEANLAHARQSQVLYLPQDHARMHIFPRGQA